MTIIRYATHTNISQIRAFVLPRTRRCKGPPVQPKGHLQACQDFFLDFIIFHGNILSIKYKRKHMNLYSISNSKKNSIGIYSVSIRNIDASPRTFLMFSFNWLPFAAWMTAGHKWMRYFTLADTLERNRRPANCQEIVIQWIVKCLPPPQL